MASYKKGDTIYYLGSTYTINDGHKFPILTGEVEKVDLEYVVAFLDEDFKNTPMFNVIHPKILDNSSIYATYEEAYEKALSLEKIYNKEIKYREENRVLEEHSISWCGEMRIHLQDNVVVDFKRSFEAELRYKQQNEQKEINVIIIEVTYNFKKVACFKKIFHSEKVQNDEYREFIFKFLSDKDYREKYLVDGKNIPFELGWNYKFRWN